MKFTGQVRVPEVDHPGVPATIVVEEGQTEVFLEGESLGRWSLYDVRASRLVSSAFSLSLDGEEITFIADEPVDFAYKGVDHMAGVWARYKSMTIPRRVVAVGRSRRGTIPSRISELREAMLQNLQTVGRGTSRFAPIDIVTPVEPEPSLWTKRIDAYSQVPEPLDTGDDAELEIAKEPEAAVEPVAAVEPEALPDLEAAIEASPAPEPAIIERVEPDPTSDLETPSELVAFGDASPVAPRSMPLRPGPGLIPRRVESPRAADDVDAFMPPPAWEEAWEEPPFAEEPYEELPPDADVVFAAEEPPAETAAEPDFPEVAAVPEDDEQPYSEEEADPHVAGKPVEGWPTITTDEETGRRELVVDLGHLEVVDAADAGEVGSSLGVLGPPDEPSSLEPDLELLFAGAPATEGERSGLLGAVRSAFARNKTSHQHQFVEAPGGIGIVRQICADCGYISIGVSD